MACDICGAKDKALVSLRDSYKTAEVQQVCPDCEKELNTQLRKIHSITSNILVVWMKRFIGERRGAK